MNDFKAAIFDLDGTLIDSMGIWEKIDRDFPAKRNLPIPDDYIKEISARSFLEAAEYTINLFSLEETVEEVIAEWNAMAAYEYDHNVKLKQYAADYLMQLKAAGVKLAIATALPPVLFEPVLQSNGIYSLFDVACSTDEVKHGKEEPDIFLLAAERLDVSPENCIVFEDIRSAIASAKRAGMMAFGVYDRYSEADRADILKIADGYLYNFKNAPLPQGKAGCLKNRTCL